ncbi:MAG: hypothetical protein IK048_05090 [Clostridia bacterium]|nr:hypothetical protein [Clostridia bacterium]
MSSKAKIARISLIIALVLALALTLSACNFFDGATKIKDVDLVVDSGLVDSNGDGVYEIASGESFTVSIKWNNMLITNPTIRWYWAKNGEERSQLENENGKTLTRTIGVAPVGTRYEISGSANSVAGKNTIKIVVVERQQQGGSGGDTPGSGDEPSTTISFTVGVDGISDTNGNGYPDAKYGKTFTVSADFGALVVEDPIFDWYVSKDDNETKLAATGISFSYTIDSREVSRYVFRAVLKVDEGINGSNTARVDFEDSVIEGLQITSSSHAIAQNTVLQNISAGLENVVLGLSWNDDELPAELLTFSWYLKGPGQANYSQVSTASTYTFDVSSISVASEYDVRATVRYGSQSPITVNVKLSFVVEYLPIDNINLVVTQDANVKQVIANTTYKRIVASKDDTAAVTFTANILPAQANITAPVTWTVRDSKETKTFDETSNVLTGTLRYGKNVITATAENVPSRSVIVYVLTSDEFTDRRSVIQDTFIWGGNPQDHYINNQEELNMFIGYLVGTHKTAPDASSSSPNVHTYYLAPPEWRDGVNTTAAFATARSLALSLGVDESGGAAISIYGNEKICLADDSTLGEPDGAIATDYVVSQENVYVRYKEVSYEESRSKLPVDDFAETMDVENSNQLMRAVMWGYKPNIVGENAIALGQLYSKARSMLLKYVGKNMSELEKVAVIYDWLVNEVDYDYKAAYESSDINVYAYYLEGVFNFVSIDSKSGWDARAVCDGKSKAFALLCGMEGIRAERIIGTAGDEGDEAHWTGHAWNKVLIDVDDDGIREWFAIDCTWGDVAIDTDGTGKHKKEYLSYQYYLVSDDFINDTHASDRTQPAATTEIDIYDLIEINGTTLDITTQDQLLKLYLYSGGHDSIKIRCRIADSVMVNAGTRSSLTNDEEDVYYYSAA